MAESKVWDEAARVLAQMYDRERRGLWESDVAALAVALARAEKRGLLLRAGADLLEAARRVLRSCGYLRAYDCPTEANLEGALQALRDAVARYDGSRQEEAT